MEEVAVPYRGLEGLVSLMARLRSPEGCPWDRKQDYASLRRYIVEEAFELVEAIEAQDLDGVREESGDLLLQVVFLAQMAREEGAFTLDDVLEGLIHKLVVRHPHVFGEVSARTAEEVSRNWEIIKSRQRRESEKDDSALAGVPRSLPGLHRALRLQERAAKVGFDWAPGDEAPVLHKIHEEAQELEEACREGTEEQRVLEMGDLLFAVVNLSRRLGIDPEDALHRSCGKFDRRFRLIEEGLAAEGRRMRDCALEELDARWDRAKERELPPSGEGIEKEAMR